jgi:hypothetical protein
VLLSVGNLSGSSLGPSLGQAQFPASEKVTTTVSLFLFLLPPISSGAADSRSRPKAPAFFSSRLTNLRALKVSFSAGVFSVLASGVETRWSEVRSSIPVCLVYSAWSPNPAVVRSSAARVVVICAEIFVRILPFRERLLAVLVGHSNCSSKCL